MDLIEKIRKAQRVYVIGNGGSYANAEHMANDLLGCGIKAFAINAPFFSATANDFGYEFSFSRWVRIVGESGDLLIALSGSGTSRNIVKALEVANDCGLDCHLVTHYLKDRDMQQSEEDQLVLTHELMRALKK
jgi:D-sedoheptulose 7-phosphate isomerase